MGYSPWGHKELGMTEHTQEDDGIENGNPPQYSCLENSMDRGARWAAVHGVAESGPTEHMTHKSGLTSSCSS